MSQERGKQGFYTRGFTTFVIVVSFLVIAVTGTIMFFTPRGRVANWTNWMFLGLDKDQWTSIHITTAALFIIMAALHIFFNWKVLLGYLRLKKAKGLRLKKELAAALALGLFVVAGTLGGTPPFGTLVDFHDRTKDYWDRTSAAAPAPHAEELTLVEFAQQIDRPIDEVLASLQENRVHAHSEQVTLAELSRQYGLAPSDLYALIQPDGAVLQPVEHTRSGLGKMTVSEYCASRGVAAEDFLDALHQRGVEAGMGSSLRALAGSLNVTPSELVQMVATAAPDSP